jgi:hypothetical protein
MKTPVAIQPILAASLVASLVATGALLRAEEGSADCPFVFRDVGDEAGIFPHLAGIRGHAAAWGDVDGGGWPSLFVGTFHNSGSKARLLPSFAASATTTATTARPPT